MACLYAPGQPAQPEEEKRIAQALDVVLGSNFLLMQAGGAGIVGSACICKRTTIIYYIGDKSSRSDTLIPLKLACKWWPRGSSAGLPCLGHTQIN